MYNALGFMFGGTIGFFVGRAQGKPTVANEQMGDGTRGPILVKRSNVKKPKVRDDAEAYRKEREEG